MQGKSVPDRQILDAAAFCRQLVPEGSVHAFLADHRAELFSDEMFADLFPSGRERPSVPVDVICTVMVLQALEGCSDREAIRQLRTRIDWKVACGLALDDEGFDPSVLTYWRARLRRSEQPDRVFEAVRAVVVATGVLAGRDRRAIDSTVLDDAVATEDTVTQLVSQIRRVRRLVPAATNVVLRGDHTVASKPQIDWSDRAARDTLVTELVSDATAILTALDGVVLTEEGQDAVGLLALVAAQDVEPGEQNGTWRIARRVASDRIVSTVDPDSRHVHKSRSVHHDGYKAHLAVEPVTGIVTAAVLSSGNTTDGAIATALVENEDAVLVLADSAYGAGTTRAALKRRGHRLAIKPMPTRAAVFGGFDRDDFVVDEAAATVTCPAGHVAVITLRRKASFRSRCGSCALRSRCTTSTTGRQLDLTPDDAELVEARLFWRTGTFADEYRRFRPMVERSMAWLVHDGNRRLRYRGLARNQQWLALRVAALNLRRLVNLGLDYDKGWRLSSA